jgi:gluconolactonase
MATDLKSMVGDSPKITKVISDLSAAGAPVYSRIGYLLVSDPGAAKILKWNTGTLSVFREKSDGASGVTFDHQGRLITAEKRQVSRTEKDGKITVLAPAQDALDVVYAIDGNTYFTSAAGVFRVPRKGGAVSEAAQCKRPAGVALSPNQQQMYVSDAAGRNVLLFDLAADGALKNGRVFAAMTSGSPGGVKTDESGNVWIAVPDGIWVADKSGKHLGTIAIPEPPVNLNWGESFRNVFVTAKTSVYKIEARTNGTRTF